MTYDEYTEKYEGIYTKPQARDLLRILAKELAEHDCYSFCIKYSNCKGFKSIDICTEKIIDYAINNPTLEGK